MAVIKLTSNDINEMIRRTVLSVLSESIGEEMGSSMSGKEDVVEEIFNYVVKKWEQIKEADTTPLYIDRYTLNDGKAGVNFSGTYRGYTFTVPESILARLGTAHRFLMNIGINDYDVPEDKIQYFGTNERSTDGSSWAGGEYNKFVKTSAKREFDRVDLIIPSINGKLQTQGFYSTLYHELNHNESRLQLQRKHQDLSDDELEKLNFFSASKRKDDPPQFRTKQRIQGGTGNSPLGLLFSFLQNFESPEVKQAKRDLSFVFYSIWETTERNARAEGIYGELKEMGATRENFRTLYPKTVLCNQITDCNGLINGLEQWPTTGIDGIDVWNFAAKIMNMKHNRSNTDDKFLLNVKKRFIERSRYLLDVLYRKAMKVAELYFQRLEKKQQDELDKPGGGLSRLGQELGAN